MSGLHRTAYIGPSLTAALRRDPRAQVACPHCLAPVMCPCRDLRGYIVPMHKKRGAWRAEA